MDRTWVFNLEDGSTFQFKFSFYSFRDQCDFKQTNNSSENTDIIYKTVVKSVDKYKINYFFLI